MWSGLGYPRRCKALHDAARANAFQSDWVRDRPAAPRFIGRRELRNVNLAELAQFIDWGPFFQTWELAGPYPAILDDPLVGEAARNVFAEGQAMLQQAIAGRWLTANGVFGLYPAASVGDDIVLCVNNLSRFPQPVELDPQPLTFDIIGLADVDRDQAVAVSGEDFGPVLAIALEREHQAILGPLLARLGRLGCFVQGHPATGVRTAARARCWNRNIRSRW